MNSRYQIESQTEPLAAISIPLRQDTEHLQTSHDMFTPHPLPGEGAVLFLVIGCQGVVLRLLLRGLAIPVVFLYPLVATVRYIRDAR